MITFERFLSFIFQKEQIFLKYFGTVLVPSKTALKVACFTFSTNKNRQRKAVKTLVHQCFHRSKFGGTTQI